MNDSDDPRYGEEPVRRYLLGQLAEEEMDQLEEEMLRDDRQFHLAEAIEAELLEALALGTLPPAERDLVQSRLAASPGGRERLALERGLDDEAQRRKIRRFPTWARRWAAAAAVVILSFAGYESLRPDEVVTFELTPIVHRGADAARQLPVPRQTDQVDLHVHLGEESGDEFQAVVREWGAGGDEAWGPQLLPVQALSMGGRGVTLEIDEDDLPPGRYTLEVWQPGAQVTVDGSDGLVAYQEFEVVRP